MDHLKKLFDVRGRVAFVTGAASGIGRAAAEILVDGGCHVLLFDRDADTLKNTVDELRNDVCTIEGIVGDVTDGREVRAAIDALVSRQGKIDILVANAGIGDPDRCQLHLTTDEGWSKTLRVNLDGVFYACRAALVHMHRQKSGSIINIASMFGLVAPAGVMDRPAYAATKGAVVNLTRELAVSYATDGIRVNALCPGFIRTPQRPSNAEVAQRMETYTPMKRLGTLEEIKASILYLASDASSFATGTTLVVDGGVLAR